jgi:hypothetical protein
MWPSLREAFERGSLRADDRDSWSVVRRAPEGPPTIHVTRFRRLRRVDDVPDRVNSRVVGSPHPGPSRTVGDHSQDDRQDRPPDVQVLRPPVLSAWTSGEAPALGTASVRVRRSPMTDPRPTLLDGRLSRRSASDHVVSRGGCGKTAAPRNVVGSCDLPSLLRAGAHPQISPDPEAKRIRHPARRLSAELQASWPDVVPDELWLGSPSPRSVSPRQRPQVRAFVGQ